MKKKKTKTGRKLLSLLLTAAMLLTTPSAAAAAESVGGAIAESDAETAAEPEAEIAAEPEAAETTEAAVDAAGAGTPANPVHHCTKKDDGTDTTDWSYVYFGSYPQTEVSGDALTAAITGASYDANGDAWVNGTKYRRISKSDTNYSGYFGDSAYRYFRWERIKWRVLQNDGSTLFAAADKGLDCKDYHDPGGSITWENCTLRSWLNSDFYGTAFSNEEQQAIVSQTVINEDNPYYNTEGGNDTSDKLYLLSIGEVTDPAYGFCEGYSTYSASRWMQASDYAHARGAYTYSSSYTGGNANCWWWLRSPGYYTHYAARVDSFGNVGRIGSNVYDDDDAVVPALHINLSSDLWSSVDDGTGGIEDKQKSRIESIYHESVNYNKAVNDFYDTVKEKFKKDAQKVNAAPQNYKQLRKWDETAADRKTNQLLTIEELAPDEAVDDAYEVLYDFLKKCLQTGIDEKLIQLDINTSESAVEIESKIVNKIYDAIQQDSGSFKGTGSNGFVVELNKTGIFGQAFGGVTIRGGKGKSYGTYIGAFCSDGKTVSAAMNQYIEDLSSEVRKMYKEAALALWKDFMQKSQLGVVTENMLREYLGDKTDYLVQKGYGKLLTSFLNMKKGMDLVKYISSVKKPADALKAIQSGDMKELYKSITKLSYTDKELTNETVKCAMEKIESSRKNLESALYDYLYNGDTYDSMNMGEKFKFFWKSVFQCPVDIEVYDENERLIGSVIDGEVFCEDDIYVELSGDVKTVYVPQGMQVHYKMICTDDGYMNYVLEEYQDGTAVGRLNYYEIPLAKGTEYTQAVEISEISEDLKEIPIIDSLGQKIYADEYIAADNNDTNINIEGTTDGNGTIIGTGTYTKGDAAELTAIAEEGFRFEGWYEDDILIAYNPNYRFTALESKKITARFSKIPLKLESYSIEISEKYKDGANVFLYSAGENCAELIISLYDSELKENLELMMLKYEEKDRVLSKEKISAVCDGGFHFIISDLTLSDWKALELLDMSGGQIAWIEKADMDTNTPEIAGGSDSGKNDGTQKPGSSNNGQIAPPTQDASGSRKTAVNKISISALSKKIAAGKKVSLTAAVSPQNASDSRVTWTSSNKKYAAVNSKGVVTTKKAGKGRTVTITATAADGSGVKAAIKLKLMKNAVTKVSLAAPDKTLKAGKSMKLKAVVKTNGRNANKALKWTSSNPKYAAVNSKGKVTAKKAGKGKTVTITAMSTDGTNKKSKVKLKIK